MVIQEHFNDLVVGTYGRGFWIMDDITPLQQLTDAVLKSSAHLFKPRDAYRMHSIAGGPSAFSRANINYYFKSVPKGAVRITILDEQGEVVSTLRGSKNVGINRATWNLRHPGARGAKLRTKPPGNPTVVEEKRFVTTWTREGWYPILSWGTSGGFRGFMVAPGTYTVKLNAGGKEYTQKLVVKKDPRSEGTLADIQDQIKMQKWIREDLNRVSDMISQIEWMRRQLYDLKDVLQEGGGSADVIKSIGDLDKKLRSVEDKLFQHTIAEGDTKSFRFPHMVYSKLSVLAEDVAGSVDFAPNKQQREVYAVLKDRMIKQQARYKELLTKDLPAFNNMLKDKGIATLINPKIK
jgi:hypothetical protein